MIDHLTVLKLSGVFERNSGGYGLVRSNRKTRSVKAVFKLLQVLMIALPVAATGATFKKMMDSYDPICSVFLSNLKAAHVEQMTDDQLCNLQMKTIMPGFTFPTWQTVAGADPTATLRQLLKADVLPKTDIPWSKNWPEIIDYANEINSRHQLYVEQTQLSQLGKTVYVQQVAVKGCFFKMHQSSADTQMKLGPDTYRIPEFSFAMESDHRKMLPFTQDPGGLSGELANFNKGKYQIVGLNLSKSWTIQADKRGFASANLAGYELVNPDPQSTNFLDGQADHKPYVYIFPICQFNIWLNAKEIRK